MAVRPAGLARFGLMVEALFSKGRQPLSVFQVFLSDAWLVRDVWLVCGVWLICFGGILKNRPKWMDVYAIELGLFFLDGLDSSLFTLWSLRNRWPRSIGEVLFFWADDVSGSSMPASGDIGRVTSTSRIGLSISIWRLPESVESFVFNKQVMGF